MQPYQICLLKIKGSCKIRCTLEKLEKLWGWGIEQRKTKFRASKERCPILHVSAENPPPPLYFSNAW